MKYRVILSAVAVISLSLLASSAEMPGDFGHQRSGNTREPDGSAKAHPEMVWFEVPKGRTATVTRGTWNQGWEAKIVIYNDDASTEVMRFASIRGHESNTDAKLTHGKRYYVTAWHKKPEGGVDITNVRWSPSHARLMMKTATTYEVQVDDGLAGTNQGDFDFNDSNLIITVKQNARR